MSSSYSSARQISHLVKSEGAHYGGGSGSGVATSNVPGAGWSNGDVLPESMYPFSRDGRMAMYQQRRWIPLTTGWTRIGQGTTEFDSRHSSSQSGQQIGDGDEDPGFAVKALMAQLCQNFYQQGWATGTGGGVSIRIPFPATNASSTSRSNADSWRVFVAPSGIQKEDMIADDIFEMDMDMNVVAPPKTPNLRPSACTPLWFCVYRHRPKAQCVIHTHSMHAQLATLLDPTETSKSLRITHLEMLKGVGNHAYDDVLEIPIIDNRPTEDALADQLELALQEFPKANAILVRRHGLYAWGDSWEQAKTQCESFDYLFQTAVLMKTQLSMDPAKVPQHGTYRELEQESSAAHSSAQPRVIVKREEGMEVDEDEEVENRTVIGPPSKKLKVSPKFDASNFVDYPPTLLLPRDGKVLILDIKGCTTPVSFFEEVLYPFVLDETKWAMANEYDGYKDEMAMGSILNDLDNELEEHGLKEEYKQNFRSKFPHGDPEIAECVAYQVRWMAYRHVEGSNFKGIQGLVWRIALKNKKFRGKVFSDMVPMLEWMKRYGVPVFIFSSDVTEQAQSPYFGSSTAGDLSKLIRRRYDFVTIGSKNDVSSFQKLVKTIQEEYDDTKSLVPSDIVFVSADECALTAARKAGLNVALSSRSGNAPVSEDAVRRFPAIQSLLQLCGEG